MTQNLDGGTAHSFRLNDGRMLSYQRFGPPGGDKVFHFHGGGLCRLDGELFATAAAKLGIEIIAVDRPGVGLSDFCENRKLLDFPDDVRQLANSLNIQRFAVQGISGGAPYALACAYKIPERLTACALISGMGPSSLVTSDMPISFRSVYWMRHAPWLVRTMLACFHKLVPSLTAMDKLLARSAGRYCKSDQEQLQKPDLRARLARYNLESRRQGARGGATDALLVTRPWGFHPSDVQFRNIMVWHGQSDKVIPVAMAVRLGEALPHCEVTLIPNEGHLSLSVNHAEEILSRLIASEKP